MDSLGHLLECVIALEKFLLIVPIGEVPQQGDLLGNVSCANMLVNFLGEVEVQAVAVLFFKVELYPAWISNDCTCVGRLQWAMRSLTSRI